ncbi:MAG: ADP-glyceromanno-heptose 6-epimerase [Candidatus Omnitrophica bacterium]|nr:ADP-glyceromanno-heptose 6-epimerase [Candidatus Omnitrophota bacterium]MBU4488559.1 ADP-glyceromanno-heptose 6-epimerase [Candidatus Omnitrophota bacterium]MCG2705434.1 ADP-glyceromanno-heptose 6-epimerase [Candidatus Omnitrophota bacterium]
MIIVTGAAGFIGSALLWKLNNKGIGDIILVDEALTSEKKPNIDSKKYKDFIEKEKFLALISSDKLGKKADAIFHLGACSSTTVTDEAYFKKNNVEYSKRLAEYAMKNKIRFIYASSAATYGDGSFGYSDEDKTTYKLKPLNAYGRSKQEFDLWVLKESLGDKVVGLKYFNVFGPNEYHKNDMRSVIAKSFDEVVTTKKMRLFKSHKKEYKDGEQKRDFIYIKDAVDATYHFLEARGKNGIYNVGTGLARTWNDLALALFAALGIPPKIEYFDMPENLRDKYQYFTQADTAKLRAGGYEKDFTALEEAVKEYAGFLKNKTYL